MQKVELYPSIIILRSMSVVSSQQQNVAKSTAAVVSRLSWEHLAFDGGGGSIRTDWQGAREGTELRLFKLPFRVQVLRRKHFKVLHDVRSSCTLTD